MANLKLSYHLFCKSILVNVIIIIQITASLIMVNDVISTSNDCYKTVNEFIDSGLSDISGVLVGCDGNLVPEDILSELPVEAVAYCEMGYSVYYSNYNFITYSKELINDYKPKIQNGKWLNDCEYNSSAIPGVLPYPIDDVNVGDTICIDEGISVIVVGILEKPYYCKFLGGSGLNTNYMMSNAYATGNTSIIICSDYLDRFPEGYAYPSMSEAIVLTDSIYLDEAYEILSSHYLCNTFDDVLHRGKAEAFARVKALSPFIIFLLIISMTGMVGCISVSTLKNLNFYSILYLCGASKKRCCAISAFYTSFYIIISIVLYFVYLFSVNGTMCIYNWIFTFFIVLILLLLTLVPYHILKKHSPIEMFNTTK